MQYIRRDRRCQTHGIGMLRSALGQQKTLRILFSFVQYRLRLASWRLDISPKPGLADAAKKPRGRFSDAWRTSDCRAAQHYCDGPMAPPSHRPSSATKA